MEPRPTSGKRFDVTFKHIVERHARDVLSFLGVHDVANVEVVSGECSTLIAAADQVLKVSEPRGEYLVHLEFQSWADPDIAPRLFWYNASLFKRYGLPVWSVLLLLSPKADHPRHRGEFEVSLPWGVRTLLFQYEVKRIWELPVESILTGGIGMLPIAPIARLPEEQLGSVLSRLKRRFEDEADLPTQKELWTTTYLLMGLRFPPDLIARMIRGGLPMKGSSTYDLIVREGKEEGRLEGRLEGHLEGRSEGALQEARELIVLLGTRKLGEPKAEVREHLERVHDLSTLHDLAIRSTEASSWEELFGLRRSKTKNKKRKR